MNPILFVEGETDKKILELAYSKFYDEAFPLSIEPTGGTQKMKALCADGAALEIAANGRKLFVVTDNDFDGREVAPKGSVAGQWRVARNRLQWWLLMPAPWYLNQVSKLNISPEMYSFSIEDCFSIGVRREAEAAVSGIAGSYKYNHGRAYPKSIDHTVFINKCNIDEEVRFCLYGPTKDAKAEFVSWLAERPSDDFIYFRYFFEELRRRLSE